MYQISIKKTINIIRASVLREFKRKSSFFGNADNQLNV